MRGWSKNLSEAADTRCIRRVQVSTEARAHKTGLAIATSQSAESLSVQALQFQYSDKAFCVWRGKVNGKIIVTPRLIYAHIIGQKGVGPRRNLDRALPL